MPGQRARARIGVFGYGEGGAIALYAAALDPRIDAVCVSGYFDDRNDVWRQPVDRNVFGLLEQFGDAEVASLVAPRTLDRRGGQGARVRHPAGDRRRAGAIDDAQARDRQGRGRAGTSAGRRAETRPPDRAGRERTGWNRAVRDRRGAAASCSDGARSRRPARPGRGRGRLRSAGPEAVARLIEAGRARHRQLHELDRHNQQLLVESPYVRQEFMKKLDTRSADAYAKTVEPYREFFADEVIGRFDLKPLPPNVRSRRIYDEPKFTGYEVVMDVFPDVIAYGILLLPKGIKEGEKRPVVVCQHGLEGRPRDVADPKVDNPAYHRFAVRLAERGFITFCTAESLHLRRPLPHPPAQGQPAQEDAVLGDRPPAPADHRLAQDAALRRPGADRLLRAELRRQVGDADPAAGQELLPVDLLGRLQRVGLEERLDAAARTATSGAASTRSSSSTWGARSTTPRWRP